ncbi:WG repeat-containing protein [uncultured Desulfobulbus sp.]|uniref:WG repeat-containing protein n=1 Tax=uncultured Desulfobulbus sp. TaxID=239745 RepID=UPI0029C7B20F|nr:WG repeat-containing protein [uncultured Desulfobulbus sp.]
MRKICLTLLLLILPQFMISCSIHKAEYIQQVKNHEEPATAVESSGFHKQFWGYIDKSGKLVIQIKFSQASRFKEGLAAVEIESGDKQLFGYINKSGKYVIKPKYISAGSFNEGLAAVSTRIKPAKSNSRDNGIRIGYINPKGELKIGYKYELSSGSEESSFSEGLAAVCIKQIPFTSEAGYINKLGKLVIKLRSNRTTPFNDGIALTDAGLINKAGKLILPKKIIINSTTSFQIFEQLIPSSEISGISSQVFISEGFVPIIDLHSLKCGYMNRNRKIVIKPTFQLAYPYSEGLGRVQTDTGQGYIDRTGKMVIPPQFRESRRFSEGLAAVMPLYKRGKLSKFGYINKSGKWVIKPEYDDAFEFHEGLAAVCISKRWGFIDKTGKMVVEPKYDIAGSFSEGRAPVAIKF